MCRKYTTEERTHPVYTPYTPWVYHTQGGIPTYKGVWEAYNTQGDSREPPNGVIPPWEAPESLLTGVIPAGEAPESLFISVIPAREAPESLSGLLNTVNKAPESLSGLLFSVYKAPESLSGLLFSY